jgi:hypothetical protein
METINTKRKAILERIDFLESAICKAREYLETGEHAKWHGFRPIFGRKENLPPHKDWIKNVFLPRQEKARARAEKILERLGEQDGVRARK